MVPARQTLRCSTATKTRTVSSPAATDRDEAAPRCRLLAGSAVGTGASSSIAVASSRPRKP